MPNKLAIYAGSFDPVTFGHIDIIKRAKAIFPEVIVAVALNTQKNPFFTIEERVEMLKKATKGMKGVTIDHFQGLIVDYAHKKNARVLIRGLRMISDFEYEFQMALTNRKLASNIETIFMMPHESFSYVSSKLLKEAAILGADLHNFVPDFVQKTLKNKLKK